MNNSESLTICLQIGAFNITISEYTFMKLIVFINCKTYSIWNICSRIDLPMVTTIEGNARYFDIVKNFEFILQIYIDQLIFVKFVVVKFYCLVCLSYRLSSCSFMLKEDIVELLSFSQDSFNFYLLYCFLMQLYISQKITD